MPGIRWLGIVWLAAAVAACSGSSGGAGNGGTGGNSAGGGGASGNSFGGSGTGGSGTGGSGTGGSGTGGSGTGGSGTGGSGTGGSSSVPLYCEPNTDGSGCLCTAADASRPATPGVTCTPADVSGGICCASAGYPGGLATTCQCVPWGCFNGSVCDCGQNMGTDQQCKPGFAHCCVPTSEVLNPSRCSCSNFPCTSDQTEVTSCGVDMAGCLMNQFRIKSCTP